jgi:hypothetical protein
MVRFAALVAALLVCSATAARDVGQRSQFLNKTRHIRQSIMLAFGVYTL